VADQATTDGPGVLHPALSGSFDLHILLRFPPPQDWRPEEPGEQLVGIVWKVYEDSFRRDTGTYSFPVLCVMDAEQRLWRVSCSAVSLKNQVSDLGVGRGSLVAITFSGRATSRAGREYRKYQMEKL